MSNKETRIVDLDENDYWSDESVYAMTSLTWGSLQRLLDKAGVDWTDEVAKDYITKRFDDPETEYIDSLKVKPVFYLSSNLLYSVLNLMDNLKPIGKTHGSQQQYREPYPHHHTISQDTLDRTHLFNAGISNILLKNIPTDQE